MENPKAVKKLAEVAALTDLLRELDKRTAGRLSSRLLPVSEIWDNFQAFDAQALVPEALHDTFIRKRRDTTAKIQGMMEAYIGDEWDNDIEVLEWSGFHLGAAVAHAALVSGYAAGDEACHAALVALLDDFRDLLTKTAEVLAVIGRSA